MLEGGNVSIVPKILRTAALPEKNNMRVSYTRSTH